MHQTLWMLHRTLGEFGASPTASLDLKILLTSDAEGHLMPSP